MIVKRLIIADPNPALVERLADHFRARGVVVKTAYDAITVLKLMHLDPPEAFCIDINMTCANGVGVCELLSDEHDFSHVPAILLTDHADDWLTHDCHDLRAYYTSKGPELARRVELLLEEASTPRVPALVR